MRNVLTTDHNCNNYFYQDDAHKIEGDKHRQEVVFDKGGFVAGLHKTQTSPTINPQARQHQRDWLNRLTAAYLRTGGSAIVCQPGKPPNFRFGRFKSPSPLRGMTRSNDLSRPRWNGPILDARTERELIRKAKSGDDQAKQKLLGAFHRLVLKIAGKHSGPSHNDLMGAGLIGFWEAVSRFNENRGCRLATYVRHWIEKYVRLAVKDWRREGESGETRQDRFIFSNPRATAEEVVAAVNGKLKDAEALAAKLKDAEAAIARLDAGHESYDTNGGAFDEDGNYTGPKVATSHEMVRKFDVLSRFQLSPQLRLHEPICGSVGRPGWIDELADYHIAERKRRLNEVGRRQYALELVARERVWTGYRSKESRHRYQTTTDINDRTKIASRFYTLIFAEQFPNKPATAMLQQYELDARIVREKIARLKALRLARPQPLKESKSERKRKRKDKWRNTQVMTLRGNSFHSQFPPTSPVPHVEFAKKTFGQSHICAEPHCSAI